MHAVFITAGDQTNAADTDHRNNGGFGVPSFVLA